MTTPTPEALRPCPKCHADNDDCRFCLGELYITPKREREYWDGVRARSSALAAAWNRRTEGGK